MHRTENCTKYPRSARRPGAGRPSRHGLRTFALGLCLLLGSPLASALNIALTNDDGWSSEGITAMRAVLLKRGHKVTLVAPLDGQSGSSAGINLDPVSLTLQDEGVYSVATSEGAGAEPATCALLAIDIAGQPDLLISGINDGANVGGLTPTSGTVGAAIAALSSSLNGSVPAIAVSTDRGADRAHFRRVAEFVADLVSHLEKKPGALAGEKALLPLRTGLNVNYPLTDRPAGVIVTRQGQAFHAPGAATALQLTFSCAACRDLKVGETVSGGRSGAGPDSTPVTEAGDAGYFAQGYITIVPIQGDYTAPTGLGLEGLLEGFER